MTLTLSIEQAWKLHDLYHAALKYYDWNEAEYHRNKELSENLEKALEEFEKLQLEINYKAEELRR